MCEFALFTSLNIVIILSDTLINCGKPVLRDVVNVVRIFGSSYGYGDVITYQCRAGVQPARYPPAITCQADGRWDGDIACGGNIYSFHSMYFFLRTKMFCYILNTCKSFFDV